MIEYRFRPISSNSKFCGSSFNAHLTQHCSLELLEIYFILVSAYSQNPFFSLEINEYKNKQRKSFPFPRVKYLIQALFPHFLNHLTQASCHEVRQAVLHLYFRMNFHTHTKSSRKIMKLILFQKTYFSVAKQVVIYT